MKYALITLFLLLAVICLPFTAVAQWDSVNQQTLTDATNTIFIASTNASAEAGDSTARADIVTLQGQTNTYALIDGTRAFTGAVDMGSVTNRDLSYHNVSNSPAGITVEVRRWYEYITASNRVFEWELVYTNGIPVATNFNPLNPEF